MTNREDDTAMSRGQRIGPDDGLVWASPLDELRAALGYSGIAKRVTPGERDKIQYENEHAPMRGELEKDDLEFKDLLQRALSSLSATEEDLVLYNPGCAEHVSLATAFPKARTIFVDPDGDVQHRFIQHNIDNPAKPFEFYRDDMHVFKLPGGIRADVVLILNAGYMTNEELNDVTKPGSLVLVNDWHGAASFMQDKCPDYTLESLYEYPGALNDIHAFRRS